MLVIKSVLRGTSGSGTRTRWKVRCPSGFCNSLCTTLDNIGDQLLKRCCEAIPPCHKHIVVCNASVEGGKPQSGPQSTFDAVSLDRISGFFGHRKPEPRQGGRRRDLTGHKLLPLIGLSRAILHRHALCMQPPAFADSQKLRPDGQPANRCCYCCMPVWGDVGWDVVIWHGSC